MLNIINFLTVSIILSMHESDLLLASKRSGANFDAYLQYSRIAEPVASLKVFFTASAKRILTQCLLHKYEVDH